MRRLLGVLLLALLPVSVFSQTVLDVIEYGADRTGRTDTTPVMAPLLKAARKAGNVPVKIVFPKGVYRFFPEQAVQKEYYISNHDQDNPKNVGIALEGFRNLTIDGNGSLFLFHGRMLPVSVVGCRHITLRNFSIDFDDPKMAQVTLTDKEEALFRVSGETDYRIENGRFVFFGDGWQIVPRSFMENIGDTGVIERIEAVGERSVAGSRQFRITFTAPLDRRIRRNTALENTVWTPEVIFRNNTVRNNRARGALFGTSKPILIENNFFDHTSGSAILLCGDANGWFESGACRDAVIRKNRFVNALTSLYQFTEAVISIDPEIPFRGLSGSCFHSGIVIEENFFDMFDRPLLYAESVNGIRFCGNEVFGNTDFRPFHPNRQTFLFEGCRNIAIEGNRFDETYGFSFEKDIRLKRTSQREVLTDAVSGCSGV